MHIGFTIATLVHSCACLVASHSWRATELLVVAGFEEGRLLPRERLFRGTEPVERRFEPDHGRIQATAGLR